METSYLKTLELDKIIARAAEGCVCKEARACCWPLSRVRHGRGALRTGTDRRHQHSADQKRFTALWRGMGAPLAARAVKGGVLSMGELLMVAGALRNFQHLTSWYGSSDHDALPTDDLFYALAPEPGAGAADLQCHSRRMTWQIPPPAPWRAAPQDPRHGEQHPRPAGKHGRNMDTSQIFAGERGFHPQRPVCCAGQERVPRRGERHHPRCILHWRHRVCGAAGCCGSQCPHSAVPPTGSAGDQRILVAFTAQVARH